MAQLRISLSGYSKGNVLRVISKDTLDRIIMDL
jgi:hypothetical protein